MGLPVEVNNLMLGSLGGYTVGRSLRFRNSATAYLSRSPASAGNQQKMTFSFWAKRGQLGVSRGIYCSGASGSGATQGGAFIQFQTTDTLTVNQQTNNAYDWILTPTQVFRDPSAWYHIVVAIDTTQATASNRVLMYVNGVQVTSFSSATYPTLNLSTKFNASGATNLGATIDAGAVYFPFDGYLAEVNFIDGQALTPSSFGAYDTNGVWQPKKYSGTYGTNGFYLPFSLNTTATYEGVFNGSSQSIGIPANSVFSFGSGNFTAECWVNAKSFSSFPALIDFWSNSSPSYITGQWQLAINTAGLLTMSIATSGSALTTIQQSSGSVILNTWNHVAVVRNGTTVTLYLNGVSVGSSTFTGTVGHSTGAGGLAKQSNSAVAYLNGSLSNVRITNNAVYTAGFTPSTSPLTAISGTQLLTLQNSTLVDNSANAISLTNNGSVTFPVSYPFSTGTAISNDQSGNGNNWTPNNISLTAGTTYDSMVDSPTVSASSSNYSVLNPLDKGGGSSSSFFLAGNLNFGDTTDGAAGNGDALGFRSTIGVSSGKWYVEGTKLNATTNQRGFGFGTPTIALGTWNGGSTNNLTTSNDQFIGIDPNSANAFIKTGSNAATVVATSLATAQNTVYGIAIDFDALQVSFYVNGIQVGSTTSFTKPTTDAIYFITHSQSATWNRSGWSLNFGQRPFAYTPPSGFKALNTYNLPAPSIANGAKYMAATTYTGNGTSISVVNNGGFQPDLVWLKDRSAAYQHHWYDSVRGVQKVIFSSLTNAESTSSTFLTAFNSNGFTFANDAGGNTNGDSYIAWQWKAGGTGVTNNSGSITSTVSANTTAGFSIVTYTGTGSGSPTIGHGLGVAPSMIIVKSRSNAVNWGVGHVSAGWANAGLLNGTNAFGGSTYFASTAPTSTVFSVQDATVTNISGATYVAYCFSAVSGYSAFGKYTGNGSTDGPFIYTGFRPRFILVKRTDTVESWNIVDTSRNPTNQAGANLYPDLTNAESNNNLCDILSNGFKLRNTWTGANTSGGTYIYAAFAENPFNISRAR